MVEVSRGWLGEAILVVLGPTGDWFRTAEAI